MGSMKETEVAKQVKRPAPVNGFKVGAFPVVNRTACLTFQGTPWEGAEVVVRLGISINVYLEIRRLMDTNDPIELTQVFGNSMLVGWNLVDEHGKAIPATGEGMKSLPDMSFALRIVNLWLEAVAGVSAPLGPPSNDGNTLVEASTALGSG